MNHAAVVIDTDEGNVRKMCLAFPEEEISGIEALRRVDTRPNRFETFNGKGSGVCMLYGVGCPSGDCFCNPARYWAYHRAGPSESTYRSSSLGASSTIVRNGDVEAWKWGPGTAPVKTSVSEVCGIPEPPLRSASTTSETTTTTAAEESPSTTSSPSEAPNIPTPTPTSVPTPNLTAPKPAATATPKPAPTFPGAPTETPSEVTEQPQETAPQEAAAAPAAAEVRRSVGAEDEDGAAAVPTEPRDSAGGGQIASLAAFTALIGGLLVWRSRIRRANLRRGRPVR